MDGAPQQDRSRVTRGKLLRSAVECLALHGYSASTVALVAEHAGVSRGAAQHHFPTRGALFTAAVEHVMDERRAELRRRFLSPEREREPDIPATVDGLFELFTSQVFRAGLVLWVAAASEPALREQVVPLEARIGREMHTLVVDLLGADEDVPGVRQMVQATLDLARGLGLAALLTDDRRRRQGIARQWAATLAASLPQPVGGSQRRL